MKEYTYKVVGVTFQGRQEHIKSLFDAEVREEFPPLEVALEGYEYEGEPALRVIVDGKEVGNIAADQVDDVVEIASKADSAIVELKLNGYTAEYIRLCKETIRDRDADEWDKEESRQILEEIKDEPIYSAAITFYIEEARPVQVTQEEVPLTKREAKKKAKEEKKRAKAEKEAEKKAVKEWVKSVQKGG